MICTRSGQELTGIALMLRCLAGRLEAEHGQAPPEIEGITRLLNNAVENTRSLARGLSPVHLERGGFATRWKDCDARVRYSDRSRSRTLAPEISSERNGEQSVSYRAEAVTNAVKQDIQVGAPAFTERARQMRLSITDDGRAWRQRRGKASKSPGLAAWVCASCGIERASQRRRSLRNGQPFRHASRFRMSARSRRRSGGSPLDAHRTRCRARNACALDLSGVASHSKAPPASRMAHVEPITNLCERRHRLRPLEKQLKLRAKETHMTTGPSLFKVRRNRDACQRVDGAERRRRFSSSTTIRSSDKAWRRLIEAEADLEVCGEAEPLARQVSIPI